MNTVKSLFKNIDQDSTASHVVSYYKVGEWEEIFWNIKSRDCCRSKLDISSFPGS